MISISAYRDPTYTPLFCCGHQIGLLRPDVKDYIVQNYSHNFKFNGNVVEINPDLNTVEKRTSAIDTMLREMREKSNFLTLKGWREETYDIKTNFDDDTILFRMERSATCESLFNITIVNSSDICFVSGLFGLRQYGVDINGYVNHPEKGLCLWMQRRSKTKQTWPGYLDNFVCLFDALDLATVNLCFFRWVEVWAAALPSLTMPSKKPMRRPTSRRSWPRL